MENYTNYLIQTIDKNGEETNNSDLCYGRVEDAEYKAERLFTTGKYKEVRIMEHITDENGKEISFELYETFIQEESEEE